MQDLILPITNTGRKYGYIIWYKTHDADVQIFFGKRKNIDLKIATKKMTRKSIDWKRRRIGITYTITRGLPTTVKFYVLTHMKSIGFTLSFK